MSTRIMPLSHQELHRFLEENYNRFNRPDFIPNDPISIPHKFSRKEDIEISGFLVALIAWGRRDSIIRSAETLMARMEWQPFEFVMNANDASLEALDGFVHRTFNSLDARAMVLSLRHAYQQHQGLEGIFSSGFQAGSNNSFDAIVYARKTLTSGEHFPQRTHKHLANPAKGSSAKRINMFLRWMIRQDRKGVDFGIWTNISPSLLICPLDVHTGNVGRELGLLTRKQNDWKAALELTESLRAFCAEDPVKYDFSLFGIGVSGLLHP